MARYTLPGGGSSPGSPVVAGAYYVAGQETIAGVAATPGWVVLTEFDVDAPMPPSAMLDAIALVSQIALDCNLRLYDVTTAAVVAGSTLTTASLTGARVATGDLIAALVAGRRYQIQAECVGGALATDFAVVRYAVLTKVP